MSKLTLPNGSSKYAAQMGRRNTMPDRRFGELRFHLQRVPFVDGCYDRWGAYWGSPANLWCAWHDDPDIRVFVRADSRESAKWKVCATLLDYGSVIFYR